MKRIYKLDKLTSNKIAAGEVVDRPASVVKELIENSLDAQSHNIIVEIREGGKNYVRVTDNGTGIHKDDTEIAFERHATSKIKSIDDLQSVVSLGFRGEALASIAAVAQMELITRTEDVVSGIYLNLNGGILKERKEIGCPKGTTFIVKHLFYNTPARAKFLKSNASEAAYISDLVAKYALAYPNISFRFINNGEIIFSTSGDGNIFNNIARIYGTEIAKNVYYLSEKNEMISMEAYIAKPSLSRGNRKLQVYFVNGRYVKNKAIADAIDDGYKTLVMTKKFPVCFIYLKVRPSQIDVNVHPAKTEIRFKNEQFVQTFVADAIRKKLSQENLIPHMHLVNNNDKNKSTIFPETKQIGINLIKDVEEQKEFSFKSLTSSENHSMPKNQKLVISEDKLSYNINSKDNEAYNKKIKKLESNNKQENPKLSNIKIIGQIFQTYLIGQDDDTLYLIDQHGAHERILYDHLIEMYKNQSVVSQNLLTPLPIELSFKEFNLVKNNIDIFKNIGFNVEEFGLNTIVLRAVPILFGEPEIKGFFLEVLDSLNKEISNGYEIKIDKIVSKACKNAIKAKDTLNTREIDELMRQLAYSANPFTCPHGRPIIISITRNDIEKKFKRI